MAYDLKVAERMRTQLEGLPVVEKKMFGGVGFLIGGNTPALASGASVACGVYQEDLVVRVSQQKHNTLLKKLHATPFDITGKPMKGWLLVEPAGCRTAKQLSAWMKEGVELASTMPPK